MKKIKAYAHCDGPCGVYDPASARVAGEAVLSMTKKKCYHLNVLKRIILRQWHHI
jgi:nickel-type superoxide dismutase